MGCCIYPGLLKPLSRRSFFYFSFTRNYLYSLSFIIYHFIIYKLSSIPAFSSLYHAALSFSFLFPQIIIIYYYLFIYHLSFIIYHLSYTPAFSSHYRAALSFTTNYLFFSNPLQIFWKNYKQMFPNKKPQKYWQL